jgi:7-cyano-7-deazaguanine synthase in queuosine biosynthesis
MKTTAVEFAVEQLEQLIPFGHQLAVRIILEQALEMEKQQIVDAYETSHISMMNAEQYYKETFNK